MLAPSVTKPVCLQFAPLQAFKTRNQDLLLQLLHLTVVNSSHVQFTSIVVIFFLKLNLRVLFCPYFKVGQIAIYKLQFFVLLESVK